MGGWCAGGAGEGLRRERCRKQGGRLERARRRLPIIRGPGGDAHRGSGKIKLSIISADPIAMVTGQRKILIKSTLFGSADGVGAGKRNLNLPAWRGAAQSRKGRTLLKKPPETATKKACTRGLFLCTGLLSPQKARRTQGGRGGGAAAARLPSHCWLFEKCISHGEL